MKFSQHSFYSPAGGGDTYIPARGCRVAFLYIKCVYVVCTLNKLERENFMSLIYYHDVYLVAEDTSVCVLVSKGGHEYLKMSCS